MAKLFDLPRYIAVEGPIRVGKSTLSTILAERLNAQRVTDPEHNSFLAPFYQGERGAAFQAQFTFLVQRFEQLRALDLGARSQKLVVSDFIFEKDIHPIPGTNWQPRSSTGLELQVILPIVNAPFRIYYAYNPLRLNKLITTPNECFNGSSTPIPCISESEFGTPPLGGAAKFTFQNTEALSQRSYLLREPKSSFRFTISTTF